MSTSSQHTPASLKHLAGYALGYAVYGRCLKVRWFRFGDRNLQLGILTSYEKKDQIFLRSKLVEELKEVKRWWDGSDSVYGVNHLPLMLQQEVRKTFCDILQTDLLVDENIISSPLYKLLLQLLFGYEAGKRFPDHWLEMNVPKLNYKALDAFENILICLKPFNCEVLNLRCKRKRKSSEKEFLEYSRILKTILQNAPRVRAILDISKTSIYPVIQSHASQVEVLTFLELPEEFLFQVFFKNQSQETVIDKLRRKKEIGITFPKLKIMGLPFAFDMDSHKLFLQVFIHCYPQIHTLYYDDIKSVSAELLMSDDREIFDLVDRTPCRLKSITLTDILEDAKHVYGITKLCPHINHVMLNDSQNPAVCSKEQMENILSKFSIESLSLKINWEYIVYPLDISLASTLKALHLELLDSLPSRDNNRLCELINNCENLECLKILFMTEYGENYGVHGDLTPSYSISEKDLNILTRLTTLSCYGQFGIEDFVKHKDLLNWLIKCSPNLSSLEISRRDIPVVKLLAESGKLDKLKSLTVIGEDYCLSWVGDLLKYPIIPLVNSIPHLQTLVLYIHPTICADVKRTLKRTALKVIDGTSEFLKDTTYNLLVRMDPGITESDLLEQFYFQD